MNRTDPIDWSFEKSRVCGRLAENGDLELFLALYCDGAVMRHIGAEMSAEDATAIFAKSLRHNANPAARARYWQVSHRRTGQALGLAALVRDADIATRGELGLMLLPKAQHTGVGVQILECVVEGVMSQRWRWAMNEVVGRHAIDNIGAGRLVQHQGFQRFDIDAPGMPGAVGWRLTADAWRARLASPASRPQHR